MCVNTYTREHVECLGGGEGGSGRNSTTLSPEQTRNAEAEIEAERRISADTVILLVSFARCSVYVFHSAAPFVFLLF